MRVLVVRANELNSRLSLLSLEKLGCRADAVRSGKEVLDRLLQVHYDAVLFDVWLSDMDGAALAAAVRAREEGVVSRPVRLIALVADESIQDSKGTLAAGIDVTLGNRHALVELKQALFGSGA